MENPHTALFFQYFSDSQMTANGFCPTVNDEIYRFTISRGADYLLFNIIHWEFHRQWSNCVNIIYRVRGACSASIGITEMLKADKSCPDNKHSRDFLALKS